ncbi:hypothetical protein NE683_02070 [Bariatricus massiliensis]|uniref:Uncharacterized protein n=1 Tax=Bariatricus massiliensis TaxID=1745713 RepID=A0ABS8DM85_9FIRM|nr:hypothetical protein [Bariatricus massiliensis]MCB7303131.1 hypothetical protein [Bariatricus massiliensis]MCB7374347.1 hypothetical protein [Bariatricus massiliensis]MCB7389568.1 hypothetical protein [Bariatricus massiliensis]MCB7413725.1 hypothetical protein [Bariatricus massiliensis]MCQ5252005.1 hypothetical protein [Bariatricus massiliensis]
MELMLVKLAILGKGLLLQVNGLTSIMATPLFKDKLKAILNLSKPMKRS